jgi:hypothetical protein
VYRVAVLFYAAVFLNPYPLRGQSPASDGFRLYAREVHQKMLLAAEVMPPDRYSFRLAPSERSFGEVIRHLGDTHEYICGRIVGSPVPNRPRLTATSAKDSLVTRLREATQGCAEMLKTLSDSTMSDSISIDLRREFVGPPPTVPRARAIQIATAYWADLYSRLSADLRLNNIVPPKPCGPGVFDGNCGSAAMLCTQETAARGGRGFAFELSDAPYSVTSDGRGPYRYGENNVMVVAITRAAVMWLGEPRPNVPPRTITVDLSRPVSGGGGVPLGRVTATGSHLEIAAQWYADPTTHRARNILDLPIGERVPAAQIDVQFPIAGRMHALQFGPQPIGHCFADPPAVHGKGTTQGTIFRQDSRTWVVELPTESIGRLFDVHYSYPHAKDLGLYYASLRFIIRAPE